MERGVELISQMALIENSVPWSSLTCLLWNVRLHGFLQDGFKG